MNNVAWRAFMLGIVCCFAVVLLSGCASAPETPDTYVLDAAIPPPPTTRRGDKVVLINPVQAQPGFDTRDIAYTQTPLALDYYTKSQWADTPARMIEPLIVRALEGTGAFRAVLTAPSPVPDDVRLDIDIIRLQQEFFRVPSEVRLTLRAKLFDVASGHVLGTQVFETTAFAPTEDAYGGVQAANSAVSRMLGQLMRFTLEYALEQ